MGGHGGGVLPESRCPVWVPEGSRSRSKSPGRVKGPSAKRRQVWTWLSIRSNTRRRTAVPYPCVCGLCTEFIGIRYAKWIRMGHGKATLLVAAVYGEVKNSKQGIRSSVWGVVEHGWRKLFPTRCWCRLNNRCAWWSFFFRQSAIWGCLSFRQLSKMHSPQVHDFIWWHAYW